MSLDDLSDGPLSHAPVLSDVVRDYLDYVKGLAEEDEVYGFAIDTLSGIAKTIELTGKVSPGQRAAVRNIVAGAAEGERTRERNKSSRRYEGFGR